MQSDLPKVTILVPSYKGASYIEQAVKSALTQDYPNLEVIVTDDVSPDNTEEVCKQFLSDTRFKYVRNQTNLGRVANYRNGLFSLANGKYVLNLDGDDYLTDLSYISRAVELAEKNELVLVFARQSVLFVSDKSIVTDKINNDLPEIIEGNWLFLNFPRGYQISHLSAMYSREEAMKADFYSHDLLSSDMESLLKLLPDHKVGFINTIAGVWRKHSTNSSRVVTNKEILDNGKYIDNVSEYTNNHTTTLSNTEIAKWRKDMLIRYFGKNIIRGLLSPKYDVQDLLMAIKNDDKDIYDSLTSDLKIRLLLTIGRSKPVLRFAMKYVLKMESMFKDFEEMENS